MTESGKTWKDQNRKRQGRMVRTTPPRKEPYWTPYVRRQMRQHTTAEMATILCSIEALARAIK